MVYIETQNTNREEKGGATHTVIRFRKSDKSNRDS